MQEVLHFLVDTLFSLLFFVFLLRLLLQWSRADFRNPLSQAVLRLSNWLIMPLRRVLPPLGKVDTASVVAVLAVALAQVAALYLVRGLGLPEVNAGALREELLARFRSGIGGNAALASALKQLETAVAANFGGTPCC